MAENLQVIFPDRLVFALPDLVGGDLPDHLAESGRVVITPVAVIPNASFCTRCYQ
ncbi:MAG: hypothetical protein KGZ45_08025 [Clostridium sp.]|nr:hypothetical protein [Clostridium sp.]